MSTNEVVCTSIEIIELTSLSMLIMSVATLFQWHMLDRLTVALLVAVATAMGRHLVELTFSGHGI